MEGLHDAEFDIAIESVEEVISDDRVPSLALGDDRLEFVIKGSDGSLKRVTVSADQMADKLLIKKDKLLTAAREGTLFEGQKKSTWKRCPKSSPAIKRSLKFIARSPEATL
ncbi:MAG: hypothetical protein LLG04_13855 [Parachlamydia sp.]|nr:hypothetical protein [Parachlamydia sp.]